MGLVKAQFSIVTITFQTNLGLSTLNSKNLIIERCRQLKRLSLLFPPGQFRVKNNFACWLHTFQRSGAALAAKTFRTLQHIQTQSIQTMALYSLFPCCPLNDAWPHAFHEDHKTLEIPWFEGTFDLGAWYKLRHMECTFLYRCIAALLRFCYPIPRGTLLNFG